MEESNIPETIEIPTPDGPRLIPLGEKPVFIVGRNGTGKSALVHFIRGQLQVSPDVRLVYLPGSRPNHFEGDMLNMTPHTRGEFEKHQITLDSSPDVRVRPITGTSRSERAIFDLQATHIQHVMNAYDDLKNGSDEDFLIESFRDTPSPLDRLNRILALANLPIRAVMDVGQLMASRDGKVFSLSRTSDGERAALILIADVLSAKPGSIFLIDEPELHLHHSIVVPLISTLIDERPDCRMLICTHELRLPAERPDCAVLIVRGCVWDSSFPSSWEVDFLLNAYEIPEDLRLDVLGSRTKIVFVEGSETSADWKILSLLLPECSVRWRESCNDVRRAVIGLRNTKDQHHIDAYGIVDNDGMGEDFKEKLRKEGVFALTFFTIESIILSKDVMDEVASKQAETFSVDKDLLISNAINNGLRSLREADVSHMASILCERRVRDNIVYMMPTKDVIKASRGDTLSLKIDIGYDYEIKKINQLIAAKDLHSIIAKYNVKESPLKDSISKSLKFLSYADYRSAAIGCLNRSPALRDLIRSKMSDVALEFV